MIIKDKSIYLNYVKDIENKVNDICKKISLATMQGPIKQDIEKTRIKILGKVFLIKNLANQETGLIPNSDWLQYQKDIDTLYKQLSDSINKASRCKKTQESVR